LVTISDLGKLDRSEMPKQSVKFVVRAKNRGAVIVKTDVESMGTRIFALATEGHKITQSIPSLRGVSSESGASNFSSSAFDMRSIIAAGKQGETLTQTSEVTPKSFDILEGDFAQKRRLINTSRSKLRDKSKLFTGTTTFKHNFQHFRGRIGNIGDDGRAREHTSNSASNSISDGTVVILVTDTKIRGWDAGESKVELSDFGRISKVVTQHTDRSRASRRNVVFS